MTEYTLSQDDIKRLKFAPQVEYKYNRFDGGWVVKRIETSFVRDNFLDNIKAGKYDKKDDTIKLE